MLSIDSIRSIAAAWNCRVETLRPDLDPGGSPERNLFRCVFEDIAGRLFVLENIPTESLGQKRRVQRTLSLLKRRGLNGIYPYRPLP